MAVVLLLALFGAMLAFGSRSADAAPGDKLYWTDLNSIFRADLDGTNIELVLADAGAWDIAIDSAAGKMYWTEGFDGNKIFRANTDGTGLEELATTGAPSGIDLDLVKGHVYWTEQASNSIKRSNLDGSGVEIVLFNEFSSSSFSTPLAVDHVHGKLYWGSEGEGIFRANLDGSEAEEILSLSAGFLDISIDLTSNSIYWTSYATCGVPAPYCGSIWRANLDGSGLLLLHETAAWSVLVHPDEGDIYWTEVNIPPWFIGVFRIMRNDQLHVDTVGYWLALLLADPPPLAPTATPTDTPTPAPEPTPTPGPLPVGGIARGSGLASLPAAEESAERASPWVVVALAGMGFALGGAWYARRRVFL